METFQSIDASRRVIALPGNRANARGTGLAAGAGPVQWAFTVPGAAGRTNNQKKFFCFSWIIGQVFG